jgi:hypothetical protein
MAKRIKDPDYQKKWYKRNREHVLAYSKKYYAEHKEWAKAAHKKWKERNANRIYEAPLKSKYGITLNEYMEMFNEQKGNCAICGRNQKMFKKRLCVDHCHKTKKVRGLLCPSCNMSLGKFKNIEILESAINYLRNVL